MRAFVLMFVLGFAPAACSRGPAPVTSIPVDPRCLAISDTLSKYVSSDALPAATFAGDTRELRSGAPNTAISVDFVVGPDGVADPSTVEVVGGSNPAYEQTIAAFATKNRFVPARIDGCNVLSRFTLALR